MKLFALLEIHHDSDKGPEDVDHEHKITLHPTMDDASAARRRAMDAVRNSEMAKRIGVLYAGDPDLVKPIDPDIMVVLRSDDWWKWEVHEVETPGKEERGETE